MDEYSSRRIASGLVISRKEPSLVLRDSAENNGDQNVQVCSRVGCSRRVNSVKTAQFGSPGKAKASKTSFRLYGHGKETIGSSSRSSVLDDTSRSFLDPKMKMPVETDSETSSLYDESEEVSQCIPTSGKTEMRVDPEPENHEDAEATSAATGSSGLGPTKRFMKSTRRFGSRPQDSPACSSTSFAFKQGNQGARNGASTSTSRYNLRNLKCNSISDVVPSSYSSFSESGLSRRSDIGRKRIGEPESGLFAKGKKINGPMMDDRRNDNANRGISISDSRRSRNLSPSRDNETVSLRMQRLTGKTRVSNQENPNRLSLVESPLLITTSPQPDISLDATAFSPENQFSTRNPLNRASSFSRAGGIRDHMRPNRSLDPHDVGFVHSFMNRDALRQYNLDAIAEMLLALEGIEQAEDTTYEQLLVETNLFLGGLAFHDRHRDMRLDIDNMSYEELLALEERMGTVSTALPEEALAKCLKRSIYQGTTDCRENEDDIKCSICQEEYRDGNEVGRLGCEHKYHVECIHQWLRLKNWCPICKNSAAPLPLVSPPP